MTPGTIVVLALLALLALGYWPIGPWIRRRNARIAGAQETTEMHSMDRGEP